LVEHLLKTNKNYYKYFQHNFENLKAIDLEGDAQATLLKQILAGIIKYLEDPNTKDPIKMTNDPMLPQVKK